MAAGSGLSRRAVRRSLAWAAILVLAGVWFLNPMQLVLVILLFLPVLWLYARESLRRESDKAALGQCRSHMHGILQTLSEGVLVLDGRGLIEAVNPAVESMLGYETDELIHQSLDLILPGGSRTAAETAEEPLVAQCLDEGVPVRVKKINLLGRDGSAVPVSLSMEPLVEPWGVDGAVVILNGLSERMALENRLKLTATLDPVSGAVNRWETERHLAVELERSRRHGRPLSILMVDIDHFKRISDTYGPHNGDTVMRAARDAMSAMMRASDIVGRYGLEAFIIVLPETALDNALILAERLRDRISASAVPLDGERSAYVTISVGVAAYPESGDSVDALIQAADLALYRAKKKGRDCVVAGDGTGKRSHPTRP
jgi:diguanylate cyclase (GGDEF)-like protein/PAS domain S-box-containing protein